MILSYDILNSGLRMVVLAFPVYKLLRYGRLLGAVMSLIA